MTAASRRGRRAAGLAVVPLLALAACSGSEFSAGEQGFVSADGKVTVLDPEEREAPRAEVAGETVAGGKVSLDDHRGKVVVMPVWGSWCGWRGRPGG